MRCRSAIYLLVLFSLSFVRLNAQNWTLYSTYDFNFYVHGVALSTADSINPHLKKELFKVQSKLNYHLNDRVDILLTDDPFVLKAVSSHPDIHEGSKAGVIDVHRQQIVLDASLHPSAMLSSFRSQICHIIFNEMMYGGNLQDQMRSANLIYFPDWFLQGLILYIGEGWSSRVDNAWRNAFEEYGLRNFYGMPEKLNEYKGASFMKFIEDEYGENAISSLLYMIRLTKRLNSGMFYAFQERPEVIFAEWKFFYEDGYLSDQRKRIPIHGQLFDPEVIIEFLVIGEDHFLSLERTLGGVALIEYEAGRQKLLYKLNANELPLKKFVGSIQAVNDGFELYVMSPEGMLIVRLINDLLYKAQTDLPAPNRITSGNGNVYVLVSRIGESRLYISSQGKVSEYHTYSQYVLDGVWGEDQELLYVGNLHGDYFLMTINDGSTKRILTSKGMLRQFIPLENYLYLNADGNGAYNAVRMDLSTNEMVYLTDYRANIEYHSLKKGVLSEYVNLGERSALFITTLTDEMDYFEYDTIQPLYFSSDRKQKNVQAVDVEYDHHLDSLPQYTFQTPFPASMDFTLSNYDSLKRIYDQRHDNLGKIFDVREHFIRRSGFVQLYNELNGINSLPFELGLGSFMPNRVGIRMGASYQNQFSDRFLSINYVTFKAFLRERDLKLMYGQNLGSRKLTSVFLHRQRLVYPDIAQPVKVQTYFFQSTYILNKGTVPRYSVYVRGRYDDLIYLATESGSLQRPNTIKTRALLGFDMTHSLKTVGGDMAAASRLSMHVFSDHGFGTVGGNIIWKGELNRIIRPWLTLAWQHQMGASFGKHPDVFVLGGASSDILNSAYDRSFGEIKEPAYYHVLYGIRGFSPNYRNGTTFGYGSLELSAYPFKIFAGKPMFTSFIDKFHFVFFVDGGTSYYGKNYKDEANSLNSDSFVTPGSSFSITVRNLKRPGIVSWGGGIHSSLYSYDFGFDLAQGLDGGVWKSPLLHFSISTTFN